MPLVHVRIVRPEEYDEAGRVTALAYMEFARAGDEEWDRYLASIADVRGRVDRTVVLAAVEEGRVLGTATIEMHGALGDDDASLPPDTASLRMLGVDPSARGRGVGRALVQATIERARAEGKRYLVLRTTRQMRAAQALYAWFGFEPDPERDLVFEDGLHLVAYRLKL